LEEIRPLVGGETDTRQQIWQHAQAHNHLESQQKVRTNPNKICHVFLQIAGFSSNCRFFFKLQVFFFLRPFPSTSTDHGFSYLYQGMNILLLANTQRIRFQPGASPCVRQPFKDILHS
jgi:hypothetical protein